MSKITAELRFLAFLFICFGSTLAASQSSGSDPGQQAVDSIYETKDVTQKAKILSKTVPPLTREAVEHHTEGRVVLRAIFRSSGIITDIVAVKPLPDGLTEISVDAARNIKFIPALKDDKPVSTRIQLEYNFYIYENAQSVTRQPVWGKLQIPYTEEARHKRIQGTVTLRVALNSDGTVLVLSTIKGLPYGLTENAIEAVKHMKFTPAEIKGRPVSYLTNVSYKFSL